MKKAMSALGILLLLVYIGYQISHNLTDQIETIDAQMVSVEDKTTCEGIFIRSSIPVYGDTDKTYEFLAENGEKVSKGQKIAAVFDSLEAAASFRKASALEKDVENAEAAYEDIAGEAGGRTLDTSIFSSMQQLSGKLAEGKAWAVSSVYSGLTQAVVAREYPRDNIDGLKQSIDAMKSELKTYQSAVSSESRSVEAQTPGYFVKSTEGRQTVCTVDEMYALTPEKLSSLVSKADGTENDQNVIGYIVDSFEWYFACCVSADDGRMFESMTNSDISFPYISAEKISANVQKVMYFDNSAIVIFRCGHMNESFLGEVSDTVDIIKKSYSGIKIPKQAIHFQEDKWGVYCLTGAIVKFKPVDWIYQSDAYFVAKQAESSSKGLYLYDKIIISGKALEENKVIK